MRCCRYAHRCSGCVRASASCIRFGLRSQTGNVGSREECKAGRRTRSSRSPPQTAGDRLEMTANSLDDKKPLRDQADLWERIVEQIEALETSWKDLHGATRMVEGTSATRRWAAIRTLGQRVAQASYRNFQTNSLAGAVKAHPLARFHSDQKQGTPSAETQEEWSRAQDHALPADPRGPRSDVDFTRSCRPRGVELGRNRVAQFALQGEMPRCWFVQCWSARGSTLIHTPVVVGGCILVCRFA